MRSSLSQHRGRLRLGEGLIQTYVESLRKQKFKGSISAVLRSRRYYADKAYAKKLPWQIPITLDTSGKIISSLRVENEAYPFLTFWNSDGSLLYWRYVGGRVLGGKSLDSLLQLLYSTKKPLIDTTRMQQGMQQWKAYAGGIEAPLARWRKPAVVRVLELQDDSTTMVGKITQVSLSRDTKWLAAQDMSNYSCDVF